MLHSNIDEAYNLILSGKISDWTKNGLENDVLTAKIDTLVRQEKSAAGNKNLMVARVACLIDPILPIKFKDMTFFPDGIAKATFVALKEKKNLKATSAGIALIDTIKVDLLKSAKLTGLWENKLRKIESKEYDALQFINELKTLISSIVIEVLSDNSGNKIIIAADSKANSSASEKPKRKPSIRKYEQIACPLCGKGHIVKGKTAYGCSEFRNGCTFRATFDEFPETLTPSQLNKKLIAKSK